MAFKTMILAAIVLLAPLASAQYGMSATSMTGPLMSRGTMMGARFVLNDDVMISELKGVWSNTGRQTPLSAEMATDNSTMPDCSVDVEGGFGSYKGLDYGSGNFYVLAGSGGVNWVVVNGQRTNFFSNVTYNTSRIGYMSATSQGCTHFQPYVDMATGELKAESISITQWSMNATSGRPNRMSLNCEVTGMEEVGCYTGSIASAPGSSSTPMVSTSSIGAPAPEGSIRTVSRNTYTCLQGECLRLNPKFSTTSPVYGCGMG